MIETRKCCKCEAIKPLTEYEKDKAREGGRRTTCSQCRAASRRVQRAEKANSDWKGHRESRRKHWISSKFKSYGLTAKEYSERLAEQGGVCAICGKPEMRKNNGVTFSLAVDHDHGTGAVRGLLCCQCNLMLGNADDSVAVLENAIGYLNRHKGV